MVMKSTPIAPFVVAKAKFLFEFLVIAFDTPARFDGINQLRESDALRMR